MLGLVDALVNGPALAARRAGKAAPLLLAVPLVVLACGSFAAALAGVLHLAPGLRATLPEDAAVAAAASAICAAFALPVIASGHRLPWLLPLWVGPCVGAAGWAVLPMPHGFATRLAETVGLLLPLMVVYLAASWRRVPAGLAEAAAASGASPFRAMRYAVLRPALPILARGVVLVFVLALGLAPLLPNALVLAPMASNP